MKIKESQLRGRAIKVRSTRLKSLILMIGISAFSLTTYAILPLLPAIGLAIEVVGIGLSVYELVKDDDLGEAANKKIEETLKAQLAHGLKPLHSLDPKLRALLGGQGRIELGIQQLSGQLDQWGEKLQSGQGEIKELIVDLSKKNESGHRETQRMLSHIQKAEFNTGLRVLSDATVLLSKKNTNSTALREVSTAKGKLLSHMEFLKEEMKTGVEVSVEHLALVHLSLASCYFAMELEGKALRELSHLIALPSQGEGLARLQKILPERVTKAKLAYFDNDTPEMKSRVKHLQFVQSQNLARLYQLVLFDGVYRSEVPRLKGVSFRSHQRRPVSNQIRSPVGRRL